MIYKPDGKVYFTINADICAELRDEISSFFYLKGHSLSPLHNAVGQIVLQIVLEKINKT